MHVIQMALQTAPDCRMYCIIVYIIRHMGLLFVINLICLFVSRLVYSFGNLFFLFLNLIVLMHFYFANVLMYLFKYCKKTIISEEPDDPNQFSNLRPRDICVSNRGNSAG